MYRRGQYIIAVHNSPFKRELVFQFASKSSNISRTHINTITGTLILKGTHKGLNNAYILKTEVPLTRAYRLEPDS